MKKWTRRELLPLLGAGLVGSAFVSSRLDKPTDAEKTQLKKFPLYLQPQKLEEGDTIGICTPAGALRRKEEVAEFTTILNELGFQVKVGDHVYNKYGYLAGADEERASDFMRFIEDETVKGIFFLRGGWGCARILPLLDFNLIQQNRKVIMGFSDATSLLNAITEHSGIVTFHGPSGNSTWNKFSIDYLKNTAMKGALTQFPGAASTSSIKTYVGGVAYGALWGGNLSVLVSMIGTPYFPKIENGLLFLEEVGEEPYRIDRMLTQLKQAKVFDTCNGIILGNFRKCTAEEPNRAFTLEEVFEQHFNDFGKPVFYGAPIGHTVNKFTVPIGGDATMDGDSGTFQLNTPAVE